MADTATDGLPTILLTVPEGFAVRSYLLTDYLSTLTQEARVVLLTPQAHEEGFKSRFESDRVTVEFLNAPPLSRFEQEVRELFAYAHYFRVKSAYWQEWFSYQHLNPANNTGTLRNWVLTSLIRPAEKALARTLLKRLSIEGQAALERLLFRRLVREAHRMKEVIARHRVDLLVSSLTLSAHWERAALWAASDLGVPKIFNSTAWDNLHTKGQLPIRFDRFVVWSQWMAGVLSEHYPDIPTEDIVIAGHPYFDFYQREQMIGDRDSFIRGLGGDPSRPLVMWACAPSGQADHEPRMIERLMQAIRQGAISRDPQVLIRPHPAGGRHEWEPLLDRFPELLFMETNKVDTYYGASWAPEYDDVSLAVASVAHSDVMINFSSTISLEAFIVDCPVVNVSYDHVPGSYSEAFTQHGYTCGSYEPVVDLKATRIATSPEELLTHVNSYLQDPGLDRDARREVLELICGPMDGGAAKRSAQAALDFLRRRAPSPPLSGA
jgi:hypothetical protein